MPTAGVAPSVSQMPGDDVDHFRERARGGVGVEVEER
jgi:hypothetical protein